ncbi:10039_t:CDS:2 [Gigaspora margarita]|uniref:10039_t:CDS:1 n=1 Tax=Gigaspora margarita TaxID=4874 RepID=A0ABN7VFN9_GIGMA|nr:10039_t:CDS:2 [Gigaspora margarita]
MAPETNNPTEVQDDTMEIDDSAKKIKEICEQLQGSLQGRVQGRAQGRAQEREGHKEGHEKELIQLILANQDEFQTSFALQIKLTIRKAINFISDAWEEVSEVTIRNCWKTIRIIPETNKPKESESDDEPKDKISEVNDATILVSDFSSETNLVAQELENNSIIEATKAIEALEKVIRYQETLDVGIGFDEYELSAL